MGKSKIIFEIEQQAYNKISKALKAYGEYEIGGILIGYKKARNHFKISEVSVANDIQRFNIISFIREPFKSIKILIKLFKKKNYNYIGEWHSHPRFDLYPSAGDIKTMDGILDDPNYGVNFVLLIICKLNKSKVNIAGYLFHKTLKQFSRAKVTFNNLKTD